MDRPQSHHYAHPAPFSTNVYWQEEINVGPGPPPQRLTRAQRRRKLNGQGPGSSGYVSPEGMHTPTGEESGGSNWNRQRYHRKDEPLWGREIHRDTRDEVGASPGRRALSGSSVGLPGAKTSSGDAMYHYALRNPPVNEYHPPIVSTPPLHRSETLWMLQPPPSPSVMAGRVPASRSQSSIGRRKAEEPGRHVVEKLTVEKVRLGENSSSEPDLQYMYRRRGGQSGERQSSELRNGEPQDGELVVASPSSGGSVEGRRKQKRRSNPIEISEDSKASDDDPIRLPRPIFITPSSPPQRSHTKRHSDSSFVEAKNNPSLILDASVSVPPSPLRSPLLSKSTEKSFNSAESYSTAPESPLSLTTQATEHASQILQEIGSPNYSLAARPSSPHLTEPRIPSPTAIVARREMLLRNEVRVPFPEPRSERRDNSNNKSTTPAERPPKSSRSIISVDMCSVAEARRLSPTVDGLTMLF
jgi:hypothetical protein